MFADIFILAVAGLSVAAIVAVAALRIRSIPHLPQKNAYVFPASLQKASQAVEPNTPAVIAQ